MKIEIATDLDQVREIVTDPYLWGLMAEDGIDSADYHVENTPFTFWLLVTTGKEICGIILINIDSSISFKVHPYMLEEHSGKGYLMMRELFRWFIRETTDLSNKINVSTPTYNEAGYKLALKMGFKDEGLNRQSFMKNGKIFDQHILGITREEVKEVVRCHQQSQQ